jgi:DUF35 OB-fold domain, acyl-CoA-associated
MTGQALIDADGAPGVRFVSNLVDCDLDAVGAGMPVRVVFHQVSERFALPPVGPGRLIRRPMEPINDSGSRLGARGSQRRHSKTWSSGQETTGHRGADVEPRMLR